MSDRCPQCDDLWRTYAAATIEHVRLLKDQEIASSLSPSQFRELEAAVTIADGIRARARIAIKRHLTKDHPEQPRAMASGQGG